jgi:hypothetical protein
MLMLRSILILALSALSIISCETAPRPYFGYDYFPMEEGHYVEYEVMEIVHDEGGNPQRDTSRFKLRRVIGKEITDNSGRQARELINRRYDLNTGELLDERVWTQVVDNGRAEVVEENQRKIKLVFSIGLDKVWDVNAFNLLDEELASYNRIHAANGAYDSTVTVAYEEFVTLVDFKKKSEVYANHIGLISRSFKDLQINNFDSLDISSGTEQYYKLLGHGVE